MINFQLKYQMFQICLGLHHARLAASKIVFSFRIIKLRNRSALNEINIIYVFVNWLDLCNKDR